MKEFLFRIFTSIFLLAGLYYSYISYNFFLILLTIITIIRALISRNEWRKIIDDGDVEIKDKISFD